MHQFKYSIVIGYISVIKIDFIGESSNYYNNSITYTCKSYLYWVQKK